MVAQDVVEVEFLVAVAQVVGVNIDGRAVTTQVAGKPRVGLACAEHGLVHVDGRVVCGEEPHVVEVRPAVVERLDATHRDVCAFGREDADGAAREPGARDWRVDDDGDVERGALVGDQVERGDVRARVDAGDLHGRRGRRACGGDDGPRGARALAQPIAHLLAHALLEGGGQALGLLHRVGLLLIRGQRQTAELLGLLVDGVGQHGLVAVCRIPGALRRLHRLDEGGGVPERGIGLDDDVARRGQTSCDLDGRVVHVQEIPGRSWHRTRMFENSRFH